MQSTEPIEVKIPPLVIKELVYSDPQSDVLETTADRVLFLSGVGSGKSQVIGVLSADFIINNPEVRGFIGANTYKQLTKSTLDRVFNVWEKQFGFIKGLHYVDGTIPPKYFKRFGADMHSYEGIISFWNGAMIFTASLENYKVIDGTEFGWACLDETKDTREVAVKEVIVARLRQKGMYINPKTNVISKTMKEGYLGYCPLFIFTSPAKTEWLSKWFGLDQCAEAITKRIFSKTDYYRKRTGRQLVIISSTWHNQSNLPAGYIEGLIADYAGNEGLIDMLIYGSPFGKSGGEYCTTYSRLTHVKEFETWKDEALQLTFDFNHIPYITGLCAQVKYDATTSRYKLRFFQEYCLPNPKNDSESLCEEIITYQEPLLNQGVFYYGDYSGGNITTVSRELKTNYQAIEKSLKKYLSNASRRVIVNQGLEKRRRFTNKLMKGALPVDVEIHPRCKELIADFEFCMLGPDGGVLKIEVPDSNGKKYQPRGHCMDAFQYLITSMFKNLFDM